MRLLLVMITFCFVVQSHAQNVGIGTNNPQQKLHVAGGVRIDGLAGATGGVLMHNSTGDLSSLGSADDTNMVLRANGTWGRLNGTVATGTVVASRLYNDVELKNRGFVLLGFIPGFTQYYNASTPVAANSWHPTYTEGDPEKYAPPYFDFNKIFFWADSVLYAFADNNWYIYNPTSDRWRFGGVNGTAFRPSSGCEMVWTGTELIVWGGSYTNATNNGFRYNPVTNVFTAIPTTGQPSPRNQFAMHHINGRLVVWGGRSGATVLGDGAVLNLATNTWSPISATGAPTGRRFFASVTNTNNNTMILWGGSTSASAAILQNNGAIYNPAANTWSAMSATNAPAIRYNHSFIWSGTEMILFGGRGQSPGEEFYNTGGRYNPATNTWTAISTTGVPGLEDHAAAWTGSRMLVSGGRAATSTLVPTFESLSYLYDPVANTWTPALSMWVNKGFHQLIPAGDCIIAIGGNTSVPNAVSGLYQVQANSIHASRFYVNAATVTATYLSNNAKLYLYIKQ